MYGFGKWIRRYGYYPPVLPLCIYTDHGPGDNLSSPFLHELDSGAPAQFYHANMAVDRWQNVSEKPCYALYSPFVFARNKLGFKYNYNASGSVYFIAHSTPLIVENKGVDAYHQEIINLPHKYHPITICLHIHDVEKGLDLAYKKLGYRVVTAGDPFNQKFTEKFYELLTQHKYAISNLFGSYALYAVEMGMPFGLYGASPEYFNAGDSNVERGVYDSYENNPYYQQAMDLFGRLPDETVTSSQQIFAEINLGLIHGITRKEMAIVLYRSLFIWLGDQFKIKFKQLRKLLG